MPFSSPIPTRLILAALIWAAALSVALGYIREGPVWPNKSTATMQLQLGAASVVLEDGSATWNDSAADALALWNGYMDAFQFAWTKGATTSQASGDGFNSVLFSNSIFGDDFGDGVLGVTILLYQIGEIQITQETDVIINQAYQYNSYRGPLKPGAPSTRVYDIHRIFLHEFGHVLGLDHPDEHGQNFTAIMNSVISDLDSLAKDDTDGAVALYGLRITSPGELDAQVGHPVKFSITSNSVISSYEATGLPPGLMLNSSTGVITGTVNVTGAFSAQVTVHGKKDLTAPLLVYVTSTKAVGELRQFWGMTVNRLITDPVHNRVYASLNQKNAVAIIDAATLTLFKTIPVASEPCGMSISPDGTTLFVAEKGETDPVIGVIDLETLVAKPSLPSPFPSFDVAAGDGRLFVTRWGSGLPEVAQIDSSTGELLAPFPSGLPAGLLQVSPDRKTLYLGDTTVTPPSLYAIDVSIDPPLLLQQTPRDRISGVLVDFKLSHDGSTLCAADGAGYAGGAILQRIPTNDLTTTDGSYVLPHAGLTRGAIAFAADDKTMLVTDQSDVGQGVDIFDAASQVYQRTIFTDYFTPLTMTVDSLGKYLFVGSFEQPELRVYALGATGLSRHAAQPKSLLNVSTRLNTQEGEQTLIGGFIISGDAPKNVLIRGIGPSLPVPGALYDARLDLYDDKGEEIALNLGWKSKEILILLTGLAPQNENDAALYATLFPGSYTVSLLGVGGAGGVGLLEVYDLSADADSEVANLATRGNVGTGDDVMIGGFIVGANDPTEVLIRAIGPSLAEAGLTNALVDPTLELHGADGELISENDDWRSDQQSEITATGIPPSDPRESAIVASLQPGPYTAIVRGKSETSGIALVEIYNLDATAAANSAASR